MITAMVPATSFLNFEYAEARRLIVAEGRSITLALAGCGGTGSWLAPSVVRVARLLIEKFNKEVRVLFIDPDEVEAKNCYRQNFCEAEIGRNKAETLAFRYGLAWGVEITAMVGRVGEMAPSIWGHEDLVVVIGCVDRPEARREIERAVLNHGRNTWWLDCGNFQAGGQVLLGCGAKVKDAFTLPGLCSWLPMPSVQHGELVEDATDLTPDPFPASEGEQEEMVCLSCADMAMADSQGLAINQRVAAEATDYLVRLLLTKDLTKYATYIDLASGSARSEYISEAAIRKFIGGDK